MERRDPGEDQIPRISPEAPKRTKYRRRPSVRLAPTMGARALVGASWNVLTKRMAANFGISLIINVVVGLIVIFLVASQMPTGPDESALEGFTAPVLVAAAALWLLGQVICAGAVTWLALEELEGRAATFGAAFAAGFRHAPRTSAAVLPAIAIYGLTLVPFIAAYRADASGGVTLLAFALSAGLGLLAAASLWLVVPIALVERRTFGAALRSIALTRGRRSMLVRAVLLLGFLYVLMALVPVVGSLTMMLVMAQAMISTGLAYVALAELQGGPVAEVFE